LYEKDGTLSAITFSPHLEQSLLGSIRTGERGRRSLGISASEAEVIVRDVGRFLREAEARGNSPVMLCATRLRPALRRLLKPSLPRLGVVGAGEVAPSVKIATVGSVSCDVAAAA
jgi:flagellar biosynthesis protein FlhA